MSTDWASILVEDRGNFVIARGKCSGKRLRDLDGSELESLGILGLKASMLSTVRSTRGLF